MLRKNAWCRIVNGHCLCWGAGEEVPCCVCGYDGDGEALGSDACPQPKEAGND